MAEEQIKCPQCGANVYGFVGSCVSCGYLLSKLLPEKRMDLEEPIVDVLKKCIKIFILDPWNEAIREYRKRLEADSYTSGPVFPGTSRCEPGGIGYKDKLENFINMPDFDLRRILENEQNKAYEKLAKRREQLLYELSEIEVRLKESEK